METLLKYIHNIYFNDRLGMNVYGRLGIEPKGDVVIDFPYAFHLQ